MIPSPAAGVALVVVFHKLTNLSVFVASASKLA
jgi:hypothetical protein